MALPNAGRFFADSHGPTGSLQRNLRIDSTYATTTCCFGHIFSRGHSDTETQENEIGNGIVELKSVEKVLPAHKKQLPVFLRLTDLKLGYWLNSGDALMRDGITPIVTKHEGYEGHEVGVRRAFQSPDRWCH